MNNQVVNLYLVFKGKGGEQKYAYINDKGQLMTDFISGTAHLFSEGVAVVEEGGWNSPKTSSYLLNAEGAKIKDFHNEITPRGFCSEGLIPAITNERPGEFVFLDQKGEIALKLGKEWGHHHSFSEGLAILSKSNHLYHHFKYIDKNGKSAFPYIFEDSVTPFNSGLAVVLFRGEDRPESFYFFNKSGIFFKPELGKIYNNHFSFSEGKIVILAPQEDNLSITKYIYVNHEGKWLFNQSFEEARSFHSGRAVVGQRLYLKINNRPRRKMYYGVIDETGEYIYPPEYEIITNFNKGVAPFCKEGRWGLFINESIQLLDPKISQINEFRTDYALTEAVYDGQVYYINRVGEIVTPKQVD